MPLAATAAKIEYCKSDVLSKIHLCFLVVFVQLGEISLAIVWGLPHLNNAYMAIRCTQLPGEEYRCLKGKV